MAERPKITRPPRAITRREGCLEVDWDGNGAGEPVDARALRLACPCAGCVEEMTGRPLLDPGTVPEDIRPLAVEPVGAYGIRIHWSDGHATGIYTWAHLRALGP
jgi:ATP-binding protein involved in chromosome partitioning